WPTRARYRCKPLKSVPERGRSVGELDLGSVAHRLYDSYSHDRHSVSGLRDREDPGSTGKPQPPQPAPRIRDRDRPDRRGRTSFGCATRNRGGTLGGGILVAWRTQLARRRDSLLCRLDQHSRGVGIRLRTPLAAAWRAGGNGRYAAVWHQHRLHLHDYASLLGGHDPTSSSYGLMAPP